MKRLLLVLIPLLGACAGSRGFDRGALSRELRADTPVVSDEEIARVLGLRPQLAPPFKLGVYFRSSQRWTGADKDALLGRLGPLVEAKAISQVIPISDSMIAREDLKSIRLAGARYGADAVLVVNGATQLDRYSNAGSALYWTIIGLFIVPGTSADALFLGSATLWDVRNEYLYASAEAEAIGRSDTSRMTSPSMRTLQPGRGWGHVVSTRVALRRSTDRVFTGIASPCCAA